MNSASTYTDHTTLPFGKYKFMKIHEVPATYIIHLYEHPKNYPGPLLRLYLEENIQRFYDRHEGLPFIIQEESFVPHCSKIAYATKAIARQVLREIRDTKGNHKKPIRSYECTFCSMWHHTSLPYEEWREQKRKSTHTEKP